MITKSLSIDGVTTVGNTYRSRQQRVWCDVAAHSTLLFNRILTAGQAFY
jgi:hypothetical protein